MTTQLLFTASFGFALFCIGGLARTYMNLRLNRHLWHGQKGQSTERRYLQLIKQRKASIWPLVLTLVLVPLGIVILFGAIIWHNKHPS